MDEAGPHIAPGGGRNHWLEAIQLTAQAISDLATVSAAPHALGLPEIRSAAIAAWEARHRDRIRRWAQRTLADRGLAGSSRAWGITMSNVPSQTTPVYCSDEDILVYAGGDFALLCPAWQQMATGNDGVFAPGARGC